jgi:hypothetical protein
MPASGPAGHLSLACTDRLPAGAFADRVGRATAAAASVSRSVAEQIAVRQEESQKQSHTAGFEVGSHVISAETIMISLPISCWQLLLTLLPAATIAPTEYRLQLCNSRCCHI